MKNLKAYQEWMDAQCVANTAKVACDAKYEAFMA